MSYLSYPFCGRKWGGDRKGVDDRKGEGMRNDRTVEVKRGEGSGTRGDK